jgi:hypothetical protein
MVNFSNQIKLAKEDFYKSKDGYIIFTEKYHLKRGYCCKSGCKHCPYGYNKETDSLKKKKNDSISRKYISRYSK